MLLNYMEVFNAYFFPPLHHDGKVLFIATCSSYKYVDASTKHCILKSFGSIESKSLVVLRL